MWNKMISFFEFIYKIAIVLPMVDSLTLNNLLTTKINAINDPEINMSTPEIITYFGYPVESHNVTTSDGYILNFFRIPHGRNQTTGPRTPLITQHGLFGSSIDWVSNFPYQSLGFLTADAGYDVWLTNIRGNSYGRQHIHLNPDTDSSFWHFSFDQMAEFDMTAIIDYILKATGYTQLYYLGYSMGTSMMFALLSSQLEYNDKVKRFVALAPVAFFSHAKSPLVLLAPYANDINLISNKLGTGEFSMSTPTMESISEVCVITIPQICETAQFLLGGFDYKEFNETRMNVYTAHSPDSTSSWAITHYAQEYENKRFCMWNWGKDENLRRYNQTDPPDYDLTKITTPTALLWGANDILATPTDTKITEAKIKNLIGSYQIGDECWTHMDFIRAIHTGTILLPKIVELLPRF